MGAKIPSPSEIGKDIMKGLRRPIKQVEKKVVDPVMRGVRKLEKVPKDLNKGFKKIKEVPKQLNNVGKQIERPIKKSFDSVGKEFKKIPKKIQKVGEDIIEPIEDFMEDVGDEITGAFDMIGDEVTNVIDEVENGFEAFGGMIVEFANTIKEFFENLGEEIAELGEDIFEFLTGLFDEIIGFFEDIWKKILKIRTFFDTVIYYLKCTVKMVVNFPSCIAIYTLDTILNSIYFIIWLTFLSLNKVGLVGYEDWWLENKKKHLDKVIKWPNDIMNRCFRCKNQKEKVDTDSIFDTDSFMSTLTEGLATLTKNSFFIFMILTVIVLCGIYVFRFMKWNTSNISSNIPSQELVINTK